MSDLNSPNPAKKRRRGFFFENLIGEGNDRSRQNHAQQLPTQYVRIMESEKRHNAKFKTQCLKTKFLIENVPENPEELLRALFQHCIDEAINLASENGIVPDRLGATIYSPLLDTDIWIGIRDINSNTADAILNRFLLVSQSKPKSLWGEPFSVEITTINRAALPLHHEIRGRGRKWPRREFKVHQKVNRRALLPVNNPPGDTRCLIYALELTKRIGIHQGTSQEFNYYLHHQKDQQRQHVNILMRAAGIPFGQPDYVAHQVVPCIVDHWNEIFAANGYKFKVFIFGGMGSYRPEYMYGPDDFTHPISLYHNNNHFDGIRRNVGSAIFSREKYCFSCFCPFDRAIDHTVTCQAKCPECGRIGAGATAGPCKIEIGFEPKYCDNCGKIFNSEECWRRHLNNNYCENSKRCPLCSKVYSVRHLKKVKQTHDCLRNYCKACFRWHPKDDPCYITPLECKPLPPYRLIIYDFECTQNQLVPNSDPPRYSHLVNFASLIVMCPSCISSGQWREPLLNRTPCRVCGPYRTITFSHNDFYGTEVDNKIISNEPLESFIDCLLHRFDPRYESVCFAHNAGRYDTVLTYKAFFNRDIEPGVLRKGNKIFELTIKKTPNTPLIKMRDSLNLLPVSLERLVGAFGLETGDKEFFPHAFNITANYNVILHDQLPPKDDYFYSSFSSEKKRRFEHWWENNQHLGFNLIEALPSYCCSDVRILAEALVAFRKEWWEISESSGLQKELYDEDHNTSVNEEEEAMEAYLGNEEEDPMLNEGMDVEFMREQAEEANSAGMDVLYEAATISSASIKYFRRRYLKENYLVRISNRPIDHAETQSTLALKFLEHYSTIHGIHVQTAHSPGGERKFGRYTVDGFCQLPDGRTRIIEVHGDIWHGCPTHYPDDEMIMPNGKTAGRLRADDKRRLEYLRECADELIIFWECEIEDMLSRDNDMREAFKKYHDKGPIKIREAFMGGRTGAERMHFKCPEGWTISYLDCNSMYPHVMVTGSFPVSVPKVHVSSHPDFIVNWQCSADIPMKGILKVFVIPPLQIDIPILPAKFDAMLTMLCSMSNVCTPIPDGWNNAKISMSAYG